MSKRKREKMKAKERRHSRGEGAKLTVIEGGSGEEAAKAPAARAKPSSEIQRTVAGRTRTGAQGSVEVSQTQSPEEPKRRGRPPKSAAAGGASQSGLSGGGRISSTTSTTSTTSATSAQADARAYGLGSGVSELQAAREADSAADKKRKRSSVKKKPAVDWSGELDLEAAPHLRDMSSGWQQLYALVGRVARREEK
ncbi:hypothetical protein [Paenibacillus puerhi]|uniref:hypothetical protein n=1 Tax=Paenibacillus puerhi TaxID=2692622 RepID=UPI0013587F20|nr:hypothetical protein [Paenibacillus puerhi]